MAEVPEPPAGSHGGGRYALLYEALRELPSGHSIKIPVEGGAKVMTYMKSALSTLAKRDGKRLLSSRNASNTTAWLWLALPQKTGK